MLVAMKGVQFYQILIFRDGTAKVRNSGAFATDCEGSWPKSNNDTWQATSLQQAIEVQKSCSSFFQVDTNSAQSETSVRYCRQDKPKKCKLVFERCDSWRGSSTSAVISFLFYVWEIFISPMQASVPGETRTCVWKGIVDSTLDCYRNSVELT